MKKISLALVLALLLPVIALAQTWGPWLYFANNVQISYARVNDKTLTWQFKGTSAQVAGWRMDWIELWV